MRWYVIVALVCCAIAPFDALYAHIRANRRREEIRRRERRAEEQEQEDRKGRRAREPEKAREDGTDGQ